MAKKQFIDKGLCYSATCGVRAVNLEDGFFSYRAKYNRTHPATLVTKPLVFTGDTFTMNFSTSARGGVYVTIRDSDLGAMEYRRVRRAIAPIPCATHAANCVIIGAVKGTEAAT